MEFKAGRYTGRAAALVTILLLAVIGGCEREATPTPHSPSPTLHQPATQPRMRDVSTVTPDQLAAQAERVRLSLNQRLKVDLQYDRAGVDWVDGYINRNRELLEQNTKQGLVSPIGAFLGECVIRTYGGHWEYFKERDEWGVTFENLGSCFPASKVAKQLDNGAEDSILSFFDMVKHLANGDMSETHSATQPDER